MALLEVKDLRVVFHTEGGTLHAVDGVSLSAEKGRTLGIVGESGCGKSVTAHSVLRLIPNPPGDIVSGEVIWKDRDILRLPQSQMPKVRGAEIAMIFQDPITSLNPVFSIRKQMTEVIQRRYGLMGEAANRKAMEALTQVGIADADRRLRNYPHEMSGGMKQRVMIAMALLQEPDLLIADEPTTALDVTIQKQILYLMRELQKRREMALILITHDLGVVAETADDVTVMYAGRIVESAPVVDLFEDPKHPYTHGLIASIPRHGVSKEEELATIEGVVPSLFNPPKACRFAGRCPRAKDYCREVDPQLREIKPGHMVACHFPIGEEES